jgi:hypothetical protein
VSLNNTCRHCRTQHHTCQAVGWEEGAPKLAIVGGTTCIDVRKPSKCAQYPPNTCVCVCVACTWRGVELPVLGSVCESARVCVCVCLSVCVGGHARPTLLPTWTCCASPADACSSNPATTRAPTRSTCTHHVFAGVSRAGLPRSLSSTLGFSASVTRRSTANGCKQAVSLATRWGGSPPTRFGR